MLGNYLHCFIIDVLTVPKTKYSELYRTSYQVLKEVVRLERIGLVFARAKLEISPKVWVVGQSPISNVDATNYR